MVILVDAYVLSTELHTTLAGHIVNNLILLVLRACECEKAGGSGRGVRARSDRSESLAAMPGEMLFLRPCRDPATPEAKAVSLTYSAVGEN